MYRCGSDVTCRFDGRQWLEFGEPMDVISITGPLVPPNANVTGAEGVRFEGTVM